MLDRDFLALEIPEVLEGRVAALPPGCGRPSIISQVTGASFRAARVPLDLGRQRRRRGEGGSQ